jgi:hypothetical protein
MNAALCTVMYLGLVVGVPAVLAFGVGIIVDGALTNPNGRKRRSKQRKPSLKDLKGYRPL